MIEQTANQMPLLNAVCMHCGYDISGTFPDAEGKVTCPECGLELTRSTRNAMTRRQFQLALLKTIALPFVIWSTITILATLPPPLRDTMFSFFFVLLFTLGYPLGLLVVMLAQWSRIHNKTREFPRPYPRWSIPLWILAYAVPVASLYALVIIVLQSVL